MYQEIPLGERFDPQGNHQELKKKITNNSSLLTDFPKTFPGNSLKIPIMDS